MMGRKWRTCLVIVFLAVVSNNAVATVSPEIDRIVRDTGRYCVTAASQDCFDRIFDFVDSNDDDLLSVEELQYVRNQMGLWFEANQHSLAPADRSGVLLAIAAVDALGIANLVRLYDEDGDARLSRNEAAADLTLDRRTFPVLASQGAAVNWASIRRRLGPSAALLDYLGIP